MNELAFFSFITLFDYLPGIISINKTDLQCLVIKIDDIFQC